jgi:stringent starvation protein B
MTSSRPYLLRAIYDWIIDNEMTPYVLVDAEEDGVDVPSQYVENGKIVLNVSPRAVNDLDMGNDLVRFSARFAGKPTDVMFPVSASLAIYAKENGQGMVFSDENGGDTPDPEPDKPGKPRLKLVK